MMCCQQISCTRKTACMQVGTARWSDGRVEKQTCTMHVLWHALHCLYL